MRTGLEDAAEGVLRDVRASGRTVLLESEGYALLQAAGLGVPEHRVLTSPAGVDDLDLDALGGERVVVKVMSPAIAHRADVGGVRIVAAERPAIAAAIREMASRFRDEPVEGYLVARFVEHDAGLGAELLLGARWTDDFGPVISLGPGGVDGERLCREMRPGREVAIFSPSLTDPDRILPILDGKAITPWIIGAGRGGTVHLAPAALRDLLVGFLRFAARHIPDDLLELEVNPLALTADGPVALDVLARVGSPLGAQPAPRPAENIRRLLRPQSIAVIGVSERMNPGHRIVCNVLREGFDPSRLLVIKPGLDSLEGCRCVPDLAALPEPVDLLVVSLDAARAVTTVEEAIAGERAHGIILIAGGMGEHEAGRGLERRLETAIAAARASPGGGAVVNGGNCLGIRSVPGRYETMFIPEERMPAPSAETAPVALIAQSGAFACSRASRMPDLQPRYNISVGNQVDLTVGDYLTHLAGDPSVEVFACYIEGFRPGDGERFARAVGAIRESGRSVVVYRAGRTPAGITATSSHTVSVAGDYVVAREILGAAGALVAPSLSDFDDMVRLLCLLRGRPPAGDRLGAISNAGFECVAIADHLGPFRLASFGEPTRRALGQLLEAARLDRVVQVQNPLDLSPIAGDQAYGRAVRLLLDAPEVDVAVVGCVPMTGALDTLPADRGGTGFAGASVTERLIRLYRDSTKPWVAVVDAGPMYDPMAARLRQGGITTFRSADRALRLLAACRSHLQAIRGDPGRTVASH
ncbi:MAG: acetate--CoA ligase family protein [Acidobacteriota bacterium]